MCTDPQPDNSNAHVDEFLLVTPAAGVAPGTALSNVPPLTLWNPGDSLYYVDIVAAVAAYISGTLGAGALALSLGRQTDTPTGGTQLYPVNRFGPGGLPPRVGGWTGATLSSVPTLLRPVAQMGAFLATTPWPVEPVDEIAVRATLPPGYCATLQGIAAAGTSPLMLLGLAFKLRPVKQ